MKTLEHLTEREGAARDHRTLGAATLTRARRHPFRHAVVDAQGAIGGLALCGAALGLRPLLELAPNERRVGVLLPPGRAGSIVNLALALDGRCAVNLNHTVGAEGLLQMIELAGLRTVVTAGIYQRKIGAPELPGRTLRVEELLPRLGKLRLIRHLLAALLLPKRMLDRARPDDVACIVFSSGSTGTPKGVQLSHRAILANASAVQRHLDMRAGEAMLSPLPLFHSFGLSSGMWLGLVDGLVVIGHPDPTDGTGIGKLAAAHAADYLLSTPTFARGYLRRIEPEQLRSLRLAVVGAEKCPAELRARFQERFGAELFEGYGCTETGPVIAVNRPETRRDGVVEVGSKDGSVGRPLPGVDVVAMDPDSRELLPNGASGLLIVRSPANMLGYLDRDDLTAAAMVHGGYDTGDMGHVDDDGFVFITGRLARFAKIGGEMVPLEKVQETLFDGLRERFGDEAQVELAVSAVPDPSRGERLLVLHTGLPCSADELCALAERLPPIFRPRAKDVHQVEALPVLGTGKLDLRGLKKLAEGLAG